MSTPAPRIASLLPSSTEIVYALGLGPQLVGISHECDHPREAADKTVLTASRVDAKASGAEIDRQVDSLLDQGLSLYTVREPQLKSVAPDLVLTQDTCQICAVPFEAAVEATRRVLGEHVDVISLSPMSLQDVLDDIQRVAAAAGVAERGRTVVADIERRLDYLRTETRDLPRPKLLHLEWMEPPMVAGHWTPELLRIAGAEPVLAHDRRPTYETPWADIEAADPDVLLIAPCGYPMDKVQREADALARHPSLAKLRAVREGRAWLADGNAFFNRPGPRLADSAEIAACACHPERFAEHFGLGPDVLRPWRPG